MVKILFCITKSSNISKPFAVISITSNGYCFPSEVFETEKEAYHFATQTLKPIYVEVIGGTGYELIQAESMEDELFKTAWNISNAFCSFMEDLENNPPSKFNHFIWKVKYESKILWEFLIHRIKNLV
jgi:hypothetical protein